MDCRTSRAICRASATAPRCGGQSAGSHPRPGARQWRTLVDSAAIIDHLDELVGREKALTPPTGTDRRAVLRVAALMMGACDKGLHAAYERNHHPREKVHQPWIDDCMAQMKQALAAVEAMVEPGRTTCCWAASRKPTSPPLSRAPGARPQGRHGNRDAAPAGALPQALGARSLPLDRAVTVQDAYLPPLRHHAQDLLDDDQCARQGQHDLTASRPMHELELEPVGIGEEQRVVARAIGRILAGTSMIRVSRRTSSACRRSTSSRLSACQAR